MKRFLVLFLLPITLMAGDLGFFSCDDHAWISGEALLLRPTAADNYFAVTGPTYDPVTAATLISPRGTNQNLNPGYSWAYGVEVGFRSCKKDIRLSWESLNTAYRQRFQAGPGEVIWPNLAESYQQASQLTGGSLRYKETYQWNQLDGDAGFWVAPVAAIWTRLFMGVRYARFEIDRSLILIRNIGTKAAQAFDFSDSQGVGPRVGAGLRACIWEGLFVKGQLAMSLLIGSTKGFHTSESYDGAGTFEASFSPSIRNKSNSLIIPETDIRFGLGYDYCLCGVALSGEVGYRIDHYFSGLQNNILQALNVGIAANEFNGYLSGGNSHPTQPFSIDGWYFGLGAQY